MKHAFTLLSFICTGVGFSAMAQQPGLTIKSYGTRKGSKKEKYTLAQFDGRWQEQSRSNIKNNEQEPITDTFYIRFFDGDKTTTKEGKSVVITGSAEIYKTDYITTSANDFRIVSIGKKEMVLDDNMGYLHKFIRTDLFAYEKDAGPPPPPLPDEKETVDLSFLKTSWYAYRRGANPGVVKPETPLIKKLDIKEKTGDNSYTGQVEYARYGKAIVEACTLTLQGGKCTITATGNTWDTELYKCTAKELIIGKKGELVYYFNNDN